VDKDAQEGPHQSLAVLGLSAAVEEVETTQEEGQALVLRDAILVGHQVAIEGLPLRPLAPLAVDEGAGVGLQQHRPIFLLAQFVALLALLGRLPDHRVPIAGVRGTPQTLHRSPAVLAVESEHDVALLGCFSARIGQNPPAFWFYSFSRRSSALFTWLRRRSECCDSAVTVLHLLPDWKSVVLHTFPPDTLEFKMRKTICQ